MDNVRQTQALDEHEINRNRIVGNYKKNLETEKTHNQNTASQKFLILGRVDT